MTSGQKKSQNEKFENQKKCQILKYWFYTKIPKKYFFGRIFPKKMSNPEILVFQIDPILGHFSAFFLLST